jgi:hypothetical protein
MKESDEPPPAAGQGLLRGLGSHSQVHGVLDSLLHSLPHTSAEELALGFDGVAPLCGLLHAFVTTAQSSQEAPVAGSRLAERALACLCLVLERCPVRDELQASSC